MIFSIPLIHTTVNTPLFSEDAKQHQIFINTSNCKSGYPNGLCLSLQWLNLSEWGTWFFFFIISLLIPAFIAIYQKDIRFFPLFFIFTGFFWNTMLMQVFSQIWLSMILIFFIFHQNQKHRLILLNTLLFLLMIGVKIHNQEFIVLLGILGIELLILLKDSAIQYFEEHPEHALVCGLLPTRFIEKITQTTSSIRDPMVMGVATLKQNFIYYSFSFFIENMFIGFVIPAIIYIFKQKWYRLISYFLLVILGAIGGWVYLDFEIWYVTRVLIWVPLVLFVPFIKWLDEQPIKIKSLFYVMGIGYFIFNVWFFLLKIQELGC